MAIIKAFHGTSVVFEKFDQSKARILNDFYGGGVAYFTENQDVALAYAQAMAKKFKTNSLVVYDVDLNIKKLFNVNDRFTGANLINFIKNTSVEDFARGAGLLRAGVDKYQIIADLKAGTANLSGDEVFKGLSRGMINTANARETIKKLGYTALRYNGGINMQDVSKIKHSVYIMYYANDIKINKAL